MTPTKIKVLVVDDTIVYRKAISDLLEELPEIEVVGVAHNGQIALSKIKQLKPDLLTLDIEMPVMDGLEVLEAINQQALNVSAIVVSTLTSEGGALTMKALDLGAVDFILKPGTSGINESKQQLRSILFPLVKEFQAGHIKQVARQAIQPKPRIRATKSKPLKTTSIRPSRQIKTAPQSRRVKSEIITMGISTGGPNALGVLIPKLPAKIGVPIVLVQHMPPIFTKSLAANLNKKSKLTVKEAEDNETLLPNVVYIAPGGKQMKIIKANNKRDRIVKINDDPPENSCRPSVDYLFRSVAEQYENKTTAIIMTGMGSDGTKGLEILRKKNAHIIAQDEESCVVFGMPKAPIERGLANVIASLDKIAEEITKSLR